ncbi:peroxisome biogenesis factor 10 [Bachmanniomyces sp. S44760]|nr:peroxisome biogenesis factor 10 [Bachmanniomyces sp. S44760]
MAIIGGSDDIAQDIQVKPERADTFVYPFAAAPDIIRSNQKDTYFQGILYEQFSTIIRTLYGVRFVHTYTSEARVFTELLYLGLTTFIGNRTLGEEYCDIIQIENPTRKLPSLRRRAGYIITTVLVPYIFTKSLPTLRNVLRRRLENGLRQASRDSKGQATHTLSNRIRSYILSNLSTITSPSPLYALSLSVFYFSGSYYHIGKRIAGLRYIFTKKVAPSEQRIGYEVLGVLLILQMTVQGWIHVNQTMRTSRPTVANLNSTAGASAMMDGAVEVDPGHSSQEHEDEMLFESEPAANDAIKGRIEASTHTPVLDQPRYKLASTEVMGWIQGKQQRKCTLCLEELKDPSVTTCGHVFCWTCIADWIREKPECPLCRQGILSQHVLPLRG